MSVTRLLECLTLINCQLALPAIRNSQRFRLSGISFQGARKPLVQQYSLLCSHSFLLFKNFFFPKLEKKKTRMGECGWNFKIKGLDAFKKEKKITNAGTDEKGI